MQQEYEFILRNVAPKKQSQRYSALEPRISTYRCRHCDELCGAEDTNMLCRDCKRKDEDADNLRDIERCDRQEREAEMAEMMREKNSNF